MAAVVKQVLPNGNLVIEARSTGDGFTSGRAVTRGKIAFPLGTLVARMKLPSGQGLWPAFLGAYPAQELAWLEAAFRREVRFFVCV